MPLESQVEEAVKKNNGVIPMQKIWSKDDQEYIETEDGVKISKEQVKLLFRETCKGELSEEKLKEHLEHDSMLEFVVFANVCKAFHYRDHAETFVDIIDGKKFCDTFAMQILVHPRVRIAMANELHDVAMRIYRKLDQKLTEIAEAVN